MPDNEKNIQDETDVTAEDLEDLKKLDGDLPEEEQAFEEALKEAEETSETLEGEVEDPEEEPSEDPEEDTENGSKEKKGLFGRKKDKKKSEMEEAIAGLTDRYQRLMAEFDNFRKRTDKEKASMYDNGVMNTVGKILPVADNFERGLSSVPEELKEDQFYKGMDQIYKQLMKVLTDLGVEAIEAEGKPFDLNLHNAVMQVPTEDESLSGTVAQELQKGYTYKGSVLRHAMVSVHE